MVSEDVLREADFHRNAMNSLAVSQNTEIRQVAKAVLDAMSWLDGNFTDLQKLFGAVRELKSEVESANDRIRVLEDRLRGN